MSTGGSDIGLIGLGVMGRNLALNIADHGFAVSVFNRTESVTRGFASAVTPRQRVQPFYSLEQFVGSLTSPRRILVMVKAGPPVDAVIAELEGLLQPGDVLIDGGNSHYRDTERRGESLTGDGIRFLGTGISGGEFGARNGPSLMPGGTEDAYESVRTIFEAIAARVDGDPCVSLLGRGGAGHYVKMVHNGIEYGLMQLLAETYALMKQALGLRNERLAEVYADWAETDVGAYLVEISAEIFKRRDDKTGNYLIDMIRGEAGQLGTGMWASQSAMELGVPTPNVDIAVAMRNLSAQVSPDPSPPTAGQRREGSLGIEGLRKALHAGMVITYAQGFAQLRVASAALGFDLRLGKVASVWRGGCIIRSTLLRDIERALSRQPEVPHLLVDHELSQVVAARRKNLAVAVEAGVSAGVPTPGLMSALAYLDSYQAEWLPFNLVQAQRDYFGAHEYRRIDEEGFFHTDWLSGRAEP